ncbi:MAG TPA: prepilin-type N-terminal cleavage/methylation domain-containing protein [Candidatus Dojkabacteria bacterium]|nr:prepilin-type N-terminal cleavage/methylation domain-containing protein [Candidatus Dojkabacteria bacterium]HRP37540.1 prepilin-type N-terminal cleavage/methylation domain-containing protein [Candidatus Dojkabacteria bacterium]HRP51681.1 prepilin-type N-terminal cleavage/methylation domain-containing protein [Candidatus Dojkabacteria bacterium]
MPSMKGFTLLEMLIVIAITGFMSVLAVPYSIKQITNNRAYDTAAEVSSAIFNAQQNANSFKNGKAYGVEVRETGYSLITSVDENLATDGLVGYWKFNENIWNGVNDETYDSSGNGNHGTPKLDTTLSSEGFGKSAKFDGTGDFIAFQDNNGVEVDTVPLSNLDNENSMAVSVWFRTNTLVGGEDSLRYIVAKESANSSGTSFILRFNTSTDRLEYYLGGASYVGVTSGVLAINTWYHAVATWDGSMMYLYLNGAQVGSASKGGLTGDSSLPVRIGSLNFGGAQTNIRNWSGEIDELRIYNLNLSSTDVTNLYNYNQRKFSKTDIPFSNGVKSNVISPAKKIINFDEGSFKPNSTTSFNIVNGSSVVFVEINTEGLINYYIN